MSPSLLRYQARQASEAGRQMQAYMLLAQARLAEEKIAKGEVDMSAPRKTRPALHVVGIGGGRACYARDLVIPKQAEVDAVTECVSSILQMKESSA